jgi:hypothetical protein
VWEISEGNNKILYAMKQVPPKDPESIVHLGTIHSKYYLEQHYSMKVLALGTTH